MSDFQKHLAELKKNPEFEDAYNLLQHVDNKMNSREKIEENYYDALGDFALFLVNWRDKHGMTQGQLADYLDMDRSFIRSCENGGDSRSLKTMNNIAGNLGYNLKIIFEPIP